MPRTVLAAALVALALLSDAAVAADNFPYGAVARPGGYMWQGPYVGGNLGYQWSGINNNPASPNGIAGGVQAGYNVQYGQFVFGGETDLQVTGANDTFAPWKFSNPWWGTLRGRAGYAWNSFLFYGTAGLAYGDIEGQRGGLSEDKVQLGWTAGLGTEVALNPKWSAKAEYLYVDLGERNFSIVGSTGFTSSVFRLGVNYRF